MEGLTLGIFSVLLIALAIYYYKLQRKSQVKYMLGVSGEILSGLAPLAYLGAAILTVFTGWQSLDNAGWIPHRQITSVWSPVEEPWAVGEYLDCIGNPKPPLTDPRNNSPGIDSLGCARNGGWEHGKGNLSAREIQVTYWGRIAIPYPESAQLYKQIMMTDTKDYDRWPFRWRCRRNVSSLTCWAVN